MPARRAALLLSGKPTVALPRLSAAVLAAYGVSLLVAGYSGPLYRLVRHSDSATMDIYARRNGQANLDSVSAWIGASFATVDTLYDQSGNAQHATQATEASRPGFSLASSVNGITPLIMGMNGTATANTSTKLTIPTTLATSRVGVTATYIGATVGPIINGALWTLGSTATPGNTLLGTDPVGGSNAAGKNYGAYASVGNNAYDYALPLNDPTPTVAITQSGASLKVRINGVSTSLTAYTSIALTGGSLGNTIYSGLIYAGAQFFGFVVHNATIPDQDAAALEAALYRIFQIPNATPTAKIIWDGDSVTAGYLYAILGNGIVSRTIQRMRHKNVGSVNIAVGGTSMQTLYGQRANVSAKYDGTLTKNMVHIWAGSNDIQQKASGSIVGVGAATFNNYLLPYIQAQQTAGFTVLVATTIPRSWNGSPTDVSQYETERLSYNSLILANSATYGYTVLDYGGIPSLTTGLTNNPPSPTYYGADLVHLNALGYDLLGATAAPQIDGLLP